MQLLRHRLRLRAVLHFGWMLTKPRLCLPYAVPALFYTVISNLRVHLQCEMDPISYQVQEYRWKNLLHSRIFPYNIKSSGWFVYIQKRISLTRYASGMRMRNRIEISKNIFSVSHPWPIFLFTLGLYCLEIHAQVIRISNILRVNEVLL